MKSQQGREARKRRRNGAAWLLAVICIFLGSVFLFKVEDAGWLRAFGFFMAALGIGPIGLWLADKRTETLSAQAENDSRRRVTESFTQALKLLGDEEVAVRQGAVHALERIAVENPDERPKITHILAAYIQNGSAAYAYKAFAAFGLIPDAEPQRDDLLLKGRLLRNIDLGSLADHPFLDDMLRDADLHPHPYKSAESVQQEIKIQAVTESVLPHSPMPVDLVSAIAAIRRRDAHEGEEALDLSHAYLYNADFTGAELPGAKLSHAHTQSCKFAGASLKGAQLQEAGFLGANLRDADLEHSNLRDATLIGAGLQGAALQHADLRGANLDGTDLQGAYLQNAQLAGTDLADANLRNAALHGANLKRAKNLTQQQIDGAQGNGDTTLPDGLQRPANWDG